MLYDLYTTLKGLFCSQNQVGHKQQVFLQTALSYEAFWKQSSLKLGFLGPHTTHKRAEKVEEAHFRSNGYVNKQNCHIWSEANPQVYVETPLNPEKLTVWCALWAGGIIGPYFFKNDEGHNVTVNGDRYRAMITNFSSLN
ncbi:uncharacterized protein TNCV_3060591 [Trichonephila clavipes]|uniref:Uncharacterized protein n=1 Tax=Trichonephila clavipes TaxID=2585209 RepID=A0A8X7BBJ2_TRICX|nr:uncharacterized protein TNCV_3060591 [Trichonephila clavipes]